MAITELTPSFFIDTFSISLIAVQDHIYTSERKFFCVNDMEMFLKADQIPYDRLDKLCEKKDIYWHLHKFESGTETYYIDIFGLVGASLDEGDGEITLMFDRVSYRITPYTEFCAPLYRKIIGAKLNLEKENEGE